MIVSGGEVSEYQSTTLGIYDKVDYVWQKRPSVSSLPNLGFLSLFREEVNILYIKVHLNGGMLMETLVLKQEF